MSEKVPVDRVSALALLGHCGCYHSNASPLSFSRSGSLKLFPYLTGQGGLPEHSGVLC